MPARQASSVCIYLAPKSSRKLARLVHTSLLDCADVPHSFSAKQRRTAFVIKHWCSSCECRPDRQTVSVRPPRTEEQTPMFAPKSSYTQACSIGRMFPITFLRSKRGRQAAFVRKIVAPTSAGQTSKFSLHSSYAEELPHACSIGTKCLTAAVQSKEEKATVFVRKQLLQVPARQASSVCIRLALWSCRKLARLVTLAAAVQSKEGRRQPLSASSFCECRPDRQVQFAFIILHQRAAASLLEWSELPDGCGAKQRGKEGRICPQACSCKCRPDRQVQFAFILLHQRAAASLLE